MQKSKGSSGAVEYLLDNKRVEEKTAVVRKGNSHITKSLISQITRQQKYISGGLMFAPGEKVTEQQKQELMQSYEDMFFAGIPENSFNILWVEHSDKNRVELNFLIPDIDLNSGYSLQNWSYNRDLHIVNTWKDIQNLEYGFIDPDENKRIEKISKAKYQGNKSIIKKRSTFQAEIEKLVDTGQLNSKDEIIEFLKNSGCEITRNGKHYISVKHKDLGKKNLKMDGKYFNDAFTKEQDIKTLTVDKVEYPKKSLDLINKRYEKYLVDRTERHSSIYKKRALKSPKKVTNSEFVSTEKKEDYDRIRENVRRGRSQRRSIIAELQAEFEKNSKRQRDSFERTRQKQRDSFKEDYQNIRDDYPGNAKNEQRRFREVQDGIIEAAARRILVNFMTISYQNKVFYERYQSALRYDLKGFYVDTKSDKSVEFKSKAKDIDIIDKGNRIVSRAGKNIKETARLMVEISAAKGWDLDKIHVKGNDAFKDEVALQIQLYKINEMNVNEDNYVENIQKGLKV